MTRAKFRLVHWSPLMDALGSASPGRFPVPTGANRQQGNMKMEIEIDITPTEVVDLTNFGICDKFDSHSAPGFVKCFFRNGQELKLLWDNFMICRFRIADDNSEAGVHGKQISKTAKWAPPFVTAGNTIVESAATR